MHVHTHNIQVPQLHNQVTIEVHTSGPVYGLDVDKSSEQSEFMFQFVSVPQVNRNYQNLGYQVNQVQGQVVE